MGEDTGDPAGHEAGAPGRAGYAGPGGPRVGITPAGA
jgi:hypothetical protein